MSRIFKNRRDVRDGSLVADTSTVVNYDSRNTNRNQCKNVNKQYIIKMLALISCPKLWSYIFVISLATEVSDTNDIS